MKRTVLMVALLGAAVFCCSVPRAWAQCNPTCQGDFNLDGQVTVDEIITAVNNALTGCATPEQGCIDSGGTVSSAICCSGVGDFPDMCATGPCGCAPQFSSEVSVCSCGGGTCFNRDQRACVPR